MHFINILMLFHFHFAAFGYALRSRRLFHHSSFFFHSDIFQKDKFIAAVPEGFGRFVFADTDDVHAGFVKADSQRRIIAVTGNNDKSIVNSLVKQVDGVNDQGNIRSVFAGHIIKLLLRLDGQPFQFVFPVL